MLLKALADAIGIYYNATGDLECFSPDAGANNASAIDAQNWNWQVSATALRPLRIVSTKSNAKRRRICPIKVGARGGRGGGGGS